MKNTVAALGTFDGLHMGHRAVLQSALEYGDFSAVCISFKGTPKNALGSYTPLLLTDEQRVEMIKKMGFERVILLDFDSVKDYSPLKFINDIVSRYGIKAVCCGFNYRFGAGASGDTELLKKYCMENGLCFTAVDPVLFDGVPVSSTEIRRLIMEGNIERANAMLSYPFFIEGKILHGQRRGRELGFPTINQDIPSDMCCAKYGVYKSRVILDGRHYTGLTNIGDCPTFSVSELRAETYIHGFSKEVYGKNARVELVRFIRPQIRFDSAGQLKLQLAKDLKTVLKDEK